MRIGSEISLALLFCAICGCSGAEKPVQSAPVRRLTFSEQQENKRFDNTDLKRQVFDMNKDGQADLWKFYAYIRQSDTEGPGDLVIVRKELDVNFDGRVDRIMFYNHKEELVREEIDTDFNGSLDRIHYYDKGLIVKTEFYQKTCNSILIDGENNPEVYPNMIRVFRHGTLTREELDERCDGIHEMVTIFNAEGSVAQIGYDDDEDGIINNWVRY